MDTKLINKLEKIKFNCNNELNPWGEGYNTGLRYAIYLIEKQDELQQTNQPTPTHYQGTIQPIDLINDQDLNFNLGNVVKYVCRAGKKQGENILTDLEKAKDYINFEIGRVKKWTNDNAKN